MLRISNITKKIDEEYRKELPIYMPIPFHFSLAGAVIDSILLSDPKTFEWFYCMNIHQVFYMPAVTDPKDHSHKLGIYRYYISPEGSNRPYGLFLKRTVLNDQIIDLNMENVIENIKRWIDNDRYIVLQADVSFLSNTRYFGDRPFRHSLFIFSYDMSNQIFKTLDFDENGKFGIITIKFKDLVNAVLSKNIRYEISLYEICKNQQFSMDKDILRLHLSEYLEGSNPSKRHRLFLPEMDYVYGMKTYRPLLNYIKMSSEYLDYRAFHALWEHKKFMTSLIAYLEQNDYIDKETKIKEQYLSVEKNSEKIKNLVIKFNITKSKVLIDKILGAIEIVSDDEYTVLNKLLDMLRS